MNYYERHIGDYLKDTAHLSLLEHGVYGRLLDVYYIREGAIPDAQAARLIGAKSKDELAAMRAVLEEFFARSEDGASWIHSRCEREIERYQDKQRKASASANARWKKTSAHSEGNANASPDAMRTHSEGNAPNHQTPDTSLQKSASHSAREPSLVGQVGQAFKRAGVNPMTINLSDPVLLALVDQGAQPDEFEGIAREAVAKGIAKPQPWVCTVLQQRRSQAQQVKLTPKTDSKEPKPWDDAA